MQASVFSLFTGELLGCGLRAAATKERQVSRQVELNLELKRVQAEHAAARAKL